MKKIMLVVIMAINAFYLSAQKISNSMIKYMPKNAMGYLVLNSSAYPSVKDWRLSIIKRSLAYDGALNETLVGMDILSNIKNFKRINSDYLRRNPQEGKYYFRLIGYDAANTRIVQSNLLSIIGDLDNPTPEACNGCPPPFGIICEEDCNGPDYAYTIVQYSADANQNTSYYSIEGAFDYFDQNLALGIPYYEYMSPTQLAIRCTNGNISHPAAAIYCSNPDGINVTLPLDGNTNIYYDANGTRIYGSVYGVAKGLGVWGTGGNIFTPVLLDGTSACSFPFSMKMSRINAYSNINSLNYPSLTCIPAFSGGSSGPIGAGASADCLGDSLPDPFSSLSSSFSNWIGAISDCYGIAGLSDPFPVTTTIQIHSLTDDLLPNVTTSLGEIQSGALELSDGLYTFGLTMSDGTYFPFINEVNSSAASNRIAQSINASSAPSILIDQELNFTIETTSKINFNYLMYNSIGVKVYEENNLSLSIGERFSKKLPLNLPKGVYVTKWIFSDGTVKSIKVIKD